MQVGQQSDSVAPCMRNEFKMSRFGHGGNLAGVLGPDPVEFEAVGHEHRDPRQIVRDLRGQRLDPGVELLFGQFLRELVDTGLPEAVTDAFTRHGRSEKWFVPQPFSRLGIVDSRTRDAPWILTCQNLIHMVSTVAETPGNQPAIVAQPNLCDNRGFP